MGAVSAVIPARSGYICFSGIRKISEIHDPLPQIRVSGNPCIKKSRAYPAARIMILLRIIAPVSYCLFYPFHKNSLFNQNILLISVLSLRHTFPAPA